MFNDELPPFRDTPEEYKLDRLQELVQAGRVLLTTKEVSEILGLKQQTLYKIACYECGDLQPLRLRKCLRWRTQDIVDIVYANKKK